MAKIGYHASHEQFGPKALLDLVQHAQAAGFQTLKSSDHFHPWSAARGQSGFAWTWIGAAMQATNLPFGLITAPGWRHHPASVAQAAATLAIMYPGRFWLALGSGEAINEAILGEYWPEKAERNARLAECAAVIRSLMAGEEVTHRGRITLIGARLYSLPPVPVPLFGAAITAETASWVAGWADGLLTVGGKPEEVAKVVDAFRAAGGEGKPVHIQHALSWAETEDKALAGAMEQWAPVIAGGEVTQDLRRPADFDQIARLVSEDEIRECVAISADLSWHYARITALAELGDYVHLHNVGRNQQAFITLFGRDVLPQLSQERR